MYIYLPFYIPNDIINYIVSHVNTINSLLNLKLTSKTFQNAVCNQISKDIDYTMLEPFISKSDYYGSNEEWCTNAWLIYKHFDKTSKYNTLHYRYVRDSNNRRKNSYNHKKILPKPGCWTPKYKLISKHIKYLHIKYMEVHHQIFEINDILKRCRKSLKAIREGYGTSYHYSIYSYNKYRKLLEERAKLTEIRKTLGMQLSRTTHLLNLEVMNFRLVSLEYNIYSSDIHI